MHFTPLIWQPCCLTLTQKFTNRYVKSIENKQLTGLRQTPTVI